MCLQLPCAAQGFRSCSTTQRIGVQESAPTDVGGAFAEYDSEAPETQNVKFVCGLPFR